MILTKLGVMVHVVTLYQHFQNCTIWPTEAAMITGQNKMKYVADRNNYNICGGATLGKEMLSGWATGLE